MTSAPAKAFAQLCQNRLFEGIGEIHARLRHAGQDIVARAVDDAVDRLDMIPDERLADDFDDRNSARGGRLEKNRNLVPGGGLENFLPMLREQRLVGGDDDFPSLNRPQVAPTLARYGLPIGHKS